MAQTQTELYNLAAQAMQARGRLISTAQTSRYNDVFNLWYPYVRPIVYASAQWPSCKKSALLTLEATRDTSLDWAATDPKPGYKYAYEAPSDMVHPFYLSSFGHFEMDMLGAQKVLNVHEEDPILHYAFDQTTLTLLEPQLFMCLSFALAAFAMMTITGKPQASLALEQRANKLIQDQRRLVTQHSDAPTEYVASWHRARGYTGFLQPERFIYPEGPLIAVGQSANVK